MERALRYIALALLAATPSLGLTIRPASAIPTGLTVMLTGDSVSDSVDDQLQARLQARLGWDLARAFVPACSLLGDPLAWPDGTYKTDATHCDIVVPRQDQVLATHPDIVLWWDRLSQMPFMTRSDPPHFKLSGTDAFWRYRRSEFRHRARHFLDSGATIVFLATEPMGVGVYDRCTTWDETRNCADWVRFRMRHYDDVTRRWNRMLRTYANNHPARTVYISITNVICRRDVSPCDDSIGNVYARPGGTHYKDEGALKAASAIVRQMRQALYPSG
jgi:hypothetical protein